jgi:glutamate/tyrosine decarboxylase-like PLP-dependent enzyme
VGSAYPGGMYRHVLEEAFREAVRYLEGVREAPVSRAGGHGEIADRLGGPMPAQGRDPALVVRELAAAAGPGLVATSGPRYFGFVVGGTLPAALAADWLTSAWDQNAGLRVMSPAAAVVESVVASWLLELFGLPPAASVGLVTGCQMANFTGLAAARGAVLARAGWDLEAEGLAGAPPIRVLVGAEAHATIYTALRYLGIGRRQIQAVPVDGQGRMRADALRAALDGGGPGPVIVCAQAGNVNTGAFDPMAEIVEAAHRKGAWVHVDGAFGLWVAVHPERRRLIEGFEAADSWATDGHKWLNVPYDSGIVAVRDPEAHRRAIANTAAPYLVSADPGQRDGQDWAPESSRRARAFPMYAALRALGREGLVGLVEGSCRLAQRMAERLSRAGFRVLNDVVLNQVLVALDPVRAGDDPRGRTAKLIEGVQREGVCWVGPTVWQGHPAVRVSVSCWQTTAEDIDRAADAIAAHLPR